MFNFLKELFSPIYLESAFFGRVRFLRSVNWWEATLLNPKNERELDLQIRADSKMGPTKKHEEFFNLITSEFPDRFPEVESKVRELWNNWNEIESEENIWKHHYLIGFSIPESGSLLENEEWTLSIQPEYDDHLFYFWMRGRKVESCSVDG